MLDAIKTKKAKDQQKQMMQNQHFIFLCSCLEYLQISHYLVYGQHISNRGRRYVTAIYFMLLVCILRMFKGWVQRGDKIKMQNINENTSNLSRVCFSFSQQSTTEWVASEYVYFFVEHRLEVLYCGIGGDCFSGSLFSLQMDVFFVFSWSSLCMCLCL